MMSCGARHIVFSVRFIREFRHHAQRAKPSAPYNGCHVAHGERVKFGYPDHYFLKTPVDTIIR
jgi:hypothetical protein